MPYKTRLELLESLYAAAFDFTLWPGFLEKVSQAPQGTKALLILADPDKGPYSVSLQSGLEPSAARKYEQYYGRRDIWFSRRSWSASEDFVFSCEEICPRNELLRTEFYNDWLRPARIEHAMGATIVVPRSGTVNLLGICRGPDQKPFGQEELDLLRFLQPHLRRAFQMFFQQIKLAKFDLTPAERRIALLIKDGKSPQEITQTLAISPNTVKGHLARIYSKTETSSRAQLVRLLLVS